MDVNRTFNQSRQKVPPPDTHRLFESSTKVIIKGGAFRHADVHAANLYDDDNVPVANTSYSTPPIAYSSSQVQPVGDRRGKYVTATTSATISVDYSDTWMELLRRNTASGAFHNSRERCDPPKCHPHTRKAVLQEIMDWIDRSELRVNKEEQFLWIYGPVGSGKSSIAQKIAEKYKAEGKLACDYFFARAAPDRNNSSNLVPTLAYQLITSYHNIRRHVAQAIIDDSLIFSRSLEAQLEALIIRPLARATSSAQQRPGRQSKPYIVVIDGLDECGPPESQRHILSALFSAVDTSFVPLIFLIASRPEQVIRDEFNGYLYSRTCRIVLDNKYRPDNDIRTFLKSKFEEIKKKHMLAVTFPSNWPADDIMDRLVSTASGQFIYASTVVKFIESPRDRPTERLDMILNLIPSESNTAFADLDVLYKEILSSVRGSKQESALTVFAFLFAASEMKFTPYISSFDASILQTAAFIELFLGYKPHDLQLVLCDLHSLVDVPPISAPSNLAEVRLFHPSFGEFLQDRERAGPDLFIDMGIYSAKFARICIKHLTPWLYSKNAEFPSSSAVVQYSYRLFLQLFSTACSDDDLLHDLLQFPVDRFIKHMFDGWLPVFSLIPLLFEWIKKQDIELYNVYIANYTGYIKSRVLSAPTSWYPRRRHIYTAVTLNVANSADFSTICKLFVRGQVPDPGQVKVIQRLLFGDLKFLIESLDITDYLSRLKQLLIDSSQSGEYYVDTSRYSELAAELFDMFTLPEKCPRILDDLVKEQKVIINLFYASLDRIPGDPTLEDYLRGNRHRKYISFLKENETELRSRIDMYTQSGDDLTTETLQARGSLTIPTMDFLAFSVPSDGRNRVQKAAIQKPRDMATPVLKRGFRQRVKNFIEKLFPC